MQMCFISHASKDRSFVEDELLRLVKAFGLETWYSPDDIMTGEEWEKAFNKGLKKCNWFILVMSPASVASKWVKKEVSWALENRIDRVIPVLYRKCKPKDFHPELPGIQYVDFRANKDKSKAVEKLIPRLRGAKYPIRRAGGIVGDWVGSVNENEGPLFPDGVVYPVKALIEVSNEEVEGHFSIELPLEGNLTCIDFTIDGAHFDGRFLHLSYISQDPDTIQFGSIISELSSDSTTMKGKFVGFSAQQESIVTGTVEMEKKNDPK